MLNSMLYPTYNILLLCFSGKGGKKKKCTVDSFDFNPGCFATDIKHITAKTGTILQLGSSHAKTKMEVKEL